MNSEFSIHLFSYHISNNISFCFFYPNSIFNIFADFSSIFGSYINPTSPNPRESIICLVPAGNNTIPEVITNTTGTARFLINPVLQNNNEIYYEINLTNVQSDISKVDLRYGSETITGPTIAILYQRILSIPIDICCKSVESDQNRDNFFLNGTITIPSLQFGLLYDVKNIGELVKMFNNNSAYVEVYTVDLDSNSLFRIKDELRGQIAAANLG